MIVRTNMATWDIGTYFSSHTFPEYACYLQELSVISDIYPILIINNIFFFL